MLFFISFSDLDKVQTGIGEKFVILFQWTGSLIAGFTIGFFRDRSATGYHTLSNGGQGSDDNSKLLIVISIIIS